MAAEHYFASATTILNQPARFRDMVFKQQDRETFVRESRFASRMDEYPGHDFFDKLRWATKTKLEKLAGAIKGQPTTRADEALAASLPITFEYPEDIPDESTEWRIKWAMWDGIMDAAKSGAPIDPLVFFWHAPWLDNMGFNLIRGRRVLLENTFTHELKHAKKMFEGGKPTYISFNFQAETFDGGVKKITVTTAHTGGVEDDDVVASCMAPDYPSRTDIRDAFMIDPARTQELLAAKPLLYLLKPEYQRYLLSSPASDPQGLIDIVLGIDMDVYRGTYDFIDIEKVLSKDNYYPENIRSLFEDRQRLYVA